MELNITQIKDILPHRYPFLLVDKITDFKPNVYADGIKCVTANEEFFNGHFPQRPVMPGVLIIEALAQVGAIAILSSEENKGKLVLFGGIKNARFKQQVIPGDVIKMRCDIIEKRGPIGFGKAIAEVNGKIAVQCELSFVVTD
ncbi:MAG: 3-hydroxyacyl-ACP dehydratase FabZ [Oscillospiraceae bacterium]